MECAVKDSCQWIGCGSAASKHAIVGLSVFETSEDVHISETSYTPEHFDLCRTHIDLARLQYVHIKEYPLGECPKPDEHGN